MTWILAALTVLLLADAWRMRRRVGLIDRLDRLGDLDPVVSPDADPGGARGFRVIAAPGVTVEPQTLEAACRYARARGVEVLDLVPHDLPAIRAMTLAQLVDPPRYRTDRVAAGRTAGHALLVTDDVARRAELDGAWQPADQLEFVRLAVRLKHFGRADLVIAPAERAGRADLTGRYQILRALLGPAAVVALAVLPALWIIFALGIWARPLWGLAALGAWQLQPLVALAATPLSPRDLLRAVVLRGPIELGLLCVTLVRRRGAEEASARRAEYEQILAKGTEHFYEPRRESCPVCGGRDLVVHLRNPDLLQRKPGRFTLERCRGCRHVFQNPRLSLAGLEFYYRDFYDGLGEAGMEVVFGYGVEPYHARARMVRDVAAPRRWLDVGAGHGHFCIAARTELPDTHFDGLDLSESIDEAQRRGWVEQAHRGLFPEIAPTMAGRYDAVSMSHYLEHTLDPRAEIEAAHTALADNGCLLIELPDPEFALGRLLRRYWLPWFQPQHLHLLSVANLERLLRERGFTPVAWHRGPAHQRVDFFFAAYLLLNHIAPPRRLPWRWRGLAAGAWRGLVWAAGTPLILAGLVIDNLAGPLFSRARVSNTYRVIATKGGQS